jgi:phospholipase/lecithinase/hemolysin
MSERERELAALFPEQDNLALFDGVVREICRESGLACVLDAFTLEESSKAAYFYDHCHPNRAGNAILARKVLEAIGRDPSLARLLS